jgi:hypothetical protein
MCDAGVTRARRMWRIRPVRVALMIEGQEGVRLCFWLAST